MSRLGLLREFLAYAREHTKLVLIPLVLLLLLLSALLLLTQSSALAPFIYSLF